MQQEHNDSTAAISTENGTRTRPIHRGLQAVALLAAVALAAGLIASPPLASMSAVVLASTCIFLVLLNLGRSRERTVARALHRKMTIGDAATTTALTRSGSTPPAIGRREAEKRNP